MHHNIYFFHVSSLLSLRTAGKAHHSCSALWVASGASEMFPWMTMRMQGQCIQSPSDGTQSLNNWQLKQTCQAVCSDPHLMGEHHRGIMAAGSVEAFSALVLPFVVEYDTNDNGKHRKHQREKDDKKEGQAT